MTMTLLLLILLGIIGIRSPYRSIKLWKDKEGTADELIPYFGRIILRNIKIEGVVARIASIIQMAIGLFSWAVVVMILGDM